MLRARAKSKRTVASLISPVAVWPAQKTRPGILVAGELCGLGGNLADEMSLRVDDMAGKEGGAFWQGCEGEGRMVMMVRRLATASSGRPQEASLHLPSEGPAAFSSGARRVATGRRLGGAARERGGRPGREELLPPSTIPLSAHYLRPPLSTGDRQTTTPMRTE